MSSAPTTPPSVDKVDGFSRKSVRKARQKRSQSSSQFRSQGKPIELTQLPLLKGKQLCTSLTIKPFMTEDSLDAYFALKEAPHVTNVQINCSSYLRAFCECSCWRNSATGTDGA